MIINLSMQFETVGIQIKTENRRKRNQKYLGTDVINAIQNKIKAARKNFIFRGRIIE